MLTASNLYDMFSDMTKEETGRRPSESAFNAFMALSLEEKDAEVLRMMSQDPESIAVRQAEEAKFASDLRSVGLNPAKYAFLLED